MTPREQVERELAEKLGFEVVDYSKSGYGFRIHRFKSANVPESWYSADADKQALWSLCVRQGVRLNEVEKGT